ncbi:MAG TPA: exodeoxyribonuclease VII large subunit [Candidatus Thermoplasmatota archaeon]|nr:exodeoxyribonuclease VII large subunit [Candidatus Thermoplasmatota archaeon]
MGEKLALAHRAARLDALSPLAVLSRGYAVALRDGKVVRRPEDAPVGSEVEVRLAKGKLGAKVTSHVEEEQ